MQIYKKDMWAVPIWGHDIPLDQIDINVIKDECYKIKKTTPTAEVSNMGGYQGHQFDISKFKELKKFKDYLNRFVETIKLDFNIPLDRPIEVKDIWVNINKKHSSNRSHIHGGVFSGVCYIQADQNSGAIYFQNPSSDRSYFLSTYTNQNSDYTCDEICFDPAPGRLIVFPSWVPHGVFPNESNRDRISIAFNFG